METSSRIGQAGIDLAFDDAMEDSPLFRASLQRNEDELEELHMILETMVKSSRSCLEHAAKLAESLGKLGPSINRMTELVIFGNQVRGLGQRLLIPMVQSVQDDLKEIREQRRQQDKLREKYDALTSKYSSLPKFKEYALIRENIFQLYDGRKQYYEQLFSYVKRINKFRKGADMFFVDKCFGTIETLRDFVSAFSSLINALSGPSKTLRNLWTNWQRETKTSVNEMEFEARDAFAIISAKHSPDAPYATTDGVAKRGHLFRKKQKAIGLGWKRVWLCLTEDCLVLEYVIGRRRGFVERLFELHVLLCEIKPWDGDRRHCFELTTSRRSLVYQAESEEEMRDWLRVFENAKAFALQQGTVDAKEDDNLDESMDDSSIYSRSAPVTPRSPATNEVVPFVADETLMTSLVCLWDEKENSYFGKLFGTEKALYLTSDIFGVKHDIKFSWIEIRQLTFKMIEVTGIITVNGVIRIQTISDESSAFDMMKLLWRNARSEYPKSVMELKKALGEITELDDDDKTTRQGEGEESIKCKCEKHLEKAEYDAIVPLGLDDLAGFLFAPQSPVYKALITKRRYKSKLNIHPPTAMLMSVDIEGYPAWNNDETDPNVATRSFELVVPVNHPLVKLKETECYESHLMKKDPNWYSLLQEAKTPTVIYGDTFVTQCLFCLKKKSVDRTRLRIFIGVKFLKHPFVKSMIRSNAMKGISEYVSDIVNCLWSELKKSNPDAIEEKLDSQVGEEKDEATGEGEKGPGPRTPLSAIISVLVDNAWGVKRFLNHHEISWSSIILFSFATLLFIISFMMWRRTKVYSHYPRFAQMKQELPINPKFYLTDHEKYYRFVASKREEYQVAYQDLTQATNSLIKAECELAHTQYVIWLTDRLARCYADLDRSPSACKEVELLWYNTQLEDSNKIC